LNVRPTPPRTGRYKPLDHCGLHRIQGRRAISTTTEQGQWFTYSGHNCGTGQQARKHAWANRHDGLIFGSGWHETGATRSADDPITASEVTDRTTLKAFVEDVRVYQESITTVTGIARLRDFFRTEGRYKSGSIFLITMTQSGNILIHGHDPTSENKNIAGVKDELDRPVGAELLAAAQQGGGFVDYRWDGIDRTAYAIQFTSGLSGNDLVMVGGFAQDLTSVPVKFTPLPRPEVPAAEVVDRQTLAIFFEEAMKEYRDATLSPNLNGLGNAKIVFRQEGGYWKSGSVYVFVISTDGYTLFHGGFPLRFEGRQFEDIDREDINGVRYLRELLAAGEAGGGFVEYMFDNPAIEGDEETGSPKIAYATGFRIPGRDQLFVVASGFYPDESVQE